MPDSAASFERHVRLSLDESKLHADLVVTEGVLRGAVTADAVLAFLDSKDVRRAAVDLDAVERLVLAANEPPGRPVQARVASGREPAHGLDAAVRLEPDIAQRLDAIRERQRLLDLREQRGPADHADEDQDAVDLRAVSAFVIVDAGQTIASVSEPTQGEDGEDVFGTAVRARAGRSLQTTIGQGLRREGHRLLSTGPGVLRASRDSIAVEPVLRVQGAVDFSTGNIDFPGDVDIAQGIRDCFSVRAAGRVTALELVEAAHIDAASLLLRSGMAGRDKGEIRVRGDAEAVYLDGVRGLVSGNLRIAREINNCTLDVRGYLDAAGAALRGGCLNLGRRGTIATIGGEGGVRTEVVLGAVAELEPLLPDALGLLARVSDRAARARKELKDLEANLTKLTPAQAERLTELEFEAATGQTRGAEIRERAQALRERILARGQTALTVVRALHRGAVLWVRGWRIEPKDTIRGPITIIVTDDGMPAWQPPKGDAAPSSLAQMADLRRDDRVPPLPEIPQAA